MATKSKILRLILAGLLLIAQQAALTHAAWHALHLPALAQELDGAGRATNDTAPQSGLCVFDVTLGQVLGGAHSPGILFCTLESGSEYIGQAPRPFSTSSSVPFFSRGPPVLLP